MPRFVRFLGCILWPALFACSGSPAGPLVPDEPIDAVQMVVSGRVLDAAGAPVAGGLVAVTVDCSSDSRPECSVGTSEGTDPEGRFVASIEQDFHVEFPVDVEVRAWPPAGMGYVLGTTTIGDLRAAFQRIPAADTTFVDIVLPPDTVDSRRPGRVVQIGHRTTDLSSDADRLYMTSPGGVSAMDQVTGQWLWQVGSTSGLAGPPYVLAGEVIVMAREGTLTALRAVDGEVLWSRDEVVTRWLTAGNEEVYASDEGRIVAYDLATGATRWTRELIGSGNVAIAATGDLVCAEILAYVECWEPSTGDPVWSRPTDFAHWLAIVGDRLILGAQSTWTAFDAGSGAPLWQTAVTTFNSPAVVENGASVFACSSAECVSIRISDGTVAWRTAIPDPGSPATDGETVYVVSWLNDSSTLYALDAATGLISERILPDPFNGEFGGTPIAGTDLVFVYGLGNLYAFEKP